MDKRQDPLSRVAEEARRMRGERISPACRLSRLEIICRLFFTPMMDFAKHVVALLEAGT